jgi:type I restriction enzyme S subunit
LAGLITSGSRGWAKYYSEDGPIFLRIANLTREHINLRLDNLIHVNPPNNSEGLRTVVKEGDLLISITADLGIIGVIPRGLPEAYVNQHIALVRINSRDANSRWIGHYLSGKRMEQLFYLLNDAGAKAGLNLQTIASLVIALPRLEEQATIVSFLDLYETRISNEKAKCQQIEQIKLGLMQALLTGKVRVKV